MLGSAYEPAVSDYGVNEALVDDRMFCCTVPTLPMLLEPVYAFV